VKNVVDLRPENWIVLVRVFPQGLKQAADGITVEEICRKARISQATYFNTD
jgi:hypothetical protein